MARKLSDRRSSLRLEALEARDQPATMVDATTLTYQDADGDAVTVSFSKPILTSTNVNSVFTFNAGTVDGNNALSQTITRIDVTGIQSARGTDIDVSAYSTNGTSDGITSVGYILAGELDLGAVFIDGQIGAIGCGDRNYSTPGLRSLTVGTISNIAAFQQTDIRGRLGTLNVTGNIDFGFFEVRGSVGEILIGGNVTGHISTDGIVGSVIVGGDLQHRLWLLGGVGSVWIKGSIDAGPSNGEAELRTNKSITKVQVDGDLVRGGITGDGIIVIVGKVSEIQIGGSVVGGGIFVGKTVGRLTVMGSVIGQALDSSGLIRIEKAVGSLTVLGDVVGGGGEHSGQVNPLDGVENYFIGGSFIGGSGPDSGAAFLGRATTVVVRGDVIGGSGPRSGEIQMYGNLRSFTLGGSIVGGTAPLSGRVDNHGLAPKFYIEGDIRGGTATATDQDLSGSGVFAASNSVGDLRIGGSLIGGDHNGHTGTNLTGAGSIVISEYAKTILIAGDIRGRSQRAQLLVTGKRHPNSIATLGTLRILGDVDRADILAGYDQFNTDPLTPLNGRARIGSVSVAGDWIASNLSAGVNIATGLRIGTGTPNPVSRIDSITIGGIVDGTAASGDTYLFTAQQIGSISVSGVPLGPLTPGPGNGDLSGLGANGDMRLKEVA